VTSRSCQVRVTLGYRVIRPGSLGTQARRHWQAGPVGHDAAGPASLEPGRHDAAAQAARAAAGPGFKFGGSDPGRVGPLEIAGSESGPRLPGGPGTCPGASGLGGPVAESARPCAGGPAATRVRLLRKQQACPW
jgi:hypothetical protein